MTNLMYSLYAPLVRPLLFNLDPEQAHELVLKNMRLIQNSPVSKLFAQKVKDYQVEAMGLAFKNPVGLAAGLDKNGDAIDFLGALGFGFLELGTVTPKPQAGNPKPRMFRIRSAQGLINRMGFNNKGVDYLVSRLQERRYRGVIGVSIGKNETTPLEQAADDYVCCLNKVYPYTDYIAVNVSCPNTPGLTKLQNADFFDGLVRPIVKARDEQYRKTDLLRPLVVKISPDLSDSQLKTLCEICLDLKIEGICCTNTTTKRDLVHGLEHAGEWGGLSGNPLRLRSTEVLRRVVAICKGKTALIGLGGISDPIGMREKKSAGADLIQVYTGFIYKGPALIKELIDNL